MNLNEKARIFLIHIEDEFRNLEDFTRNISFDEYQNTTILQYGIHKSLENIGEACNHINKKDPNSKSNFPNFDFKGWIDFRNKISHGYFSIDFDIVWATLKEDIPELKSAFYRCFESDLNLLTASGKRKSSAYPDGDIEKPNECLVEKISSSSVHGNNLSIGELLSEESNKDKDKDIPSPT